MNPLQVGIVGAGIGAGYIAGFQRQPDVQVMAVCARTPARRDALAERYHIPHIYSEYATMLAQEPLDIVVIAAPNDLHHPMTIAALQANKHVICDKPLALNANQARAMLELAEAKQRKHFVPFILRFLPAAMYLKEIIVNGFVGQPYHVNVRYFVHGWGDMHGPMRWQYDKPQAGSGSLGNVGSHAIHLVEWWLGEFKRVCAMMHTVIKERTWSDGRGRVAVEVDDTCAFLGELADGTAVVVNTSSVALVSRVKVEIEIFGSEGALTFRDSWGDADANVGSLMAMRRGDHIPTRVEIPERLRGEFLDMPDYGTPMRNCFTRMTGEFVEAIRTDRPAAPNFHDGVQVQRVLDAVIQSANEQRWIDV